MNTDLRVEGVVSEVYSSSSFKVELDCGQIILAHISGKIRINNIKIIKGDRVLCEMSPYDLTKGRIVYRLKD